MSEPKTKREAQQAAEDMDGRVELAEQRGYEAFGVRDMLAARECTRRADYFRAEAARLRALLSTLPE